jgi:hypothetical protein
MQPFTVHWSPVTGNCVKGWREAGVQLFALWPAPVNHDVCFEEAGFTDFGDRDEVWDIKADGLLTRLLAELQRLGSPRLTSEPLFHDPSPWYLRLFGKTGNTKPLELREEIELRLYEDNVPDCVVFFGDSGVSLNTSFGHQIFWIGLPEILSAGFVQCLGRVAGSHPLIQTDLKWDRLAPISGA